MGTTRRTTLAGMLAGAGLLAIPRESESAPIAAPRPSEREILAAGWDAVMASWVPNYPAADARAEAEALDHGVLVGFALATTVQGPALLWPFRAVAWAGMRPTHWLDVETWEHDVRAAAAGIDTFDLAHQDRAALERVAPKLRRAARQP